MAASIERYSIPKLNGDNYFNWKFRMEMILKEREVWNTIAEDTPSPITAAWTKSDEKAFASIALAIDDSQVQHVRLCKTAKEAWKSLQDFHEQDSPGSRVRILRTIMRQRAEENTDMKQHVNKMNELFQKLTSLNDKVDIEFLTSATLMGSLPSSYDSLITALEARKEDELTSSLVCSKIIEEYERRKERDGIANNTAALRISNDHSNNQQNNRRAIECLFCKKKGHEKKQCRKFAKWKKEKGSDKSGNNANLVGQFNNELLFVVGKLHGWILDSGATCHICCDDKQFSEIDMNHREKVSVANGNEIVSSGRGTIKIQLYNEAGISTNIQLRDVLYVPSIGGNLISVKRLAFYGYRVHFFESKCEIRGSNDSQIAVGDIHNGLYKLREKQAVNFIQNKSKMCAHQWHRVLGHRDLKVIKNLPQSGLVDGMKIDKCSDKCITDCDVCIQAKMSRPSFPKQSENRASAVLELVHSDLCGPMQTQTPGGKRYMLTFIDDYSRFTTTYFLAHKSETFDAFQHYFNKTRNLFNKTIQKLRIDGGGEYSLTEFLHFLKVNGVEVQRTAPYSPQQNGVAERKNRTLMEMARCLLSDAGMPNKYWGEAVHFANHLQNILPSKSVNRTPFEHWYNKKPIYCNLRRFGSKCFVRIQDVKRQKLDPKAEEAVLLGFAIESKAYKCYILRTQKVVISRDVKFCEDVNSKLTPLSSGKNENHSVTEEDDSFVEFVIPLIKTTDIDETAPAENEAEKNAAPAEADKPAETPLPRRSERLASVSSNRQQIQEIDIIRQNDHIDKVTQYEWLVVNGEPKTYNDAISCDNKEQWIEAMSEEMQSIQENETWDLVELPAGSKAIGCKWVFKRKEDASGNTKYKARLVAQGFSQKYGKDYDEVFAPVARQATLKILLSISANKQMKVMHFDAKNAFLNGQLKDTIYMKQPQGFQEEEKENHVCLLKKSLYGLKQSARIWNQRLHDFFIQLGMKQSSADPCLYTIKDNNSIMYIIIHVDDILSATNKEEWLTQLEEQLRRFFTINNLGEVSNYLGIRITKKDQFYFLDQENYINSIISEFGLSDAKESETPMDVSFLKATNEDYLPNNNQYRQAIGSLLYVAVNTRPDISAAVTILAQRVEKPTQRDWLEVKRIIKYLKHTATHQLQLGFINNTDLIGYADADWGEDRESRKSNSGFVFLFGGPIYWTCRKQSCVALSSTEAEFIALAEASKECIWLRNILIEFGVNVEKPTQIFEDNQSCIKLTESEKFNMRSKHIDIKAHNIQDLIQKEAITLKYIPSDDNIADLLTKPLPKAKFNDLKAKFNLN